MKLAVPSGKESIVVETQHQESLGKIHALETANKYAKVATEDQGPSVNFVMFMRLFVS